jgi:hypothetical protein
VDSIDLQLDTLSISAIIGWNDAVIFSYIFGTSTGFGSTLNQNDGINPQCGYIILYMDKNSIFTDIK